SPPQPSGTMRANFDMVERDLRGALANQTPPGASFGGTRPPRRVGKSNAAGRIIRWNATSAARCQIKRCQAHHSVERDLRGALPNQTPLGASFGGTQPPRRVGKSNAAGRIIRWNATSAARWQSKRPAAAGRIILRTTCEIL